MPLAAPLRRIEANSNEGHNLKGLPVLSTLIAGKRNTGVPLPFCGETALCDSVGGLRDLAAKRADLSFTFQGVRVSIASNWPSFLRLAWMNHAHFPGDASPAESLDAEVKLERKPWLPGRPAPTTSTTGDRIWGGGVSSDGDRVRFHSGAIEIDYRDGPAATVRATYLMDRRTRLSKWYRHVPPWEESQRLLRLGIHIPLFHRLELRGIAMLHAAAVATSKGAIIFVGLNGSGKSSLCSRLVGPFRYMSDNFALWDGERILGFPEAMRLPALDGLRVQAGSPVVFGKQVVPVGPSRIAFDAKPRAVFVLVRGASTALTPLPASEALRMVRRIHDMTHEFPSHTFLGPIATPQDPDRVATLLGAAPAFLLTMSHPDVAAKLVLDRFAPGRP